MATVAFAEDSEVTTQNRIVTVLNSNVESKIEVVNYWLTRMFSDYKPSQVGNYIGLRPTKEQIVKSSVSLYEGLKAQGLSDEEVYSYILSNKNEFVTYTVSKTDTYTFYLKLDALAVVKEDYPNVVLNSGTDNFYKGNQEFQSSVYSSLKDTGSNKPRVINQPINNVEFTKITTSKFGGRDDLYFGGNNLSNHTGLDLAMPKGTSIVATDDGVVEKVIYSDWGFGKHVIINHDGYFTLYGHCSSILVEEGQEVISGQEIAEVGNTGWSTGNHLHYEIVDDGTPVNPELFL